MQVCSRLLVSILKRYSLWVNVAAKLIIVSGSIHTKFVKFIHWGHKTCSSSGMASGDQAKVQGEVKLECISMSQSCSRIEHRAVCFLHAYSAVQIILFKIPHWNDQLWAPMLWLNRIFSSLLATLATILLRGPQTLGLGLVVRVQFQSKTWDFAETFDWNSSGPPFKWLLLSYVPPPFNKCENVSYWPMHSRM